MAIWLYSDGEGIRFGTGKSKLYEKEADSPVVRVDGSLCPIIETLAKHDSDQLGNFLDGVDKLHEKLAAQAKKQPPARKKR